MHRQSFMLAVAATLAVAPAARAQSWNGIYVAAPGDIWLVNDAGLVHGRAGSWVRAAWQAGDGVVLSAITGFGPNDVWAVGESGTVVHWNGAAISRGYAGTSANLVAVWGCGPNDIWALGTAEDQSQPTVATHYDGRSWRAQNLSLAFRPSAITGICVTGSGGGGDLVVTGISYFDPRPDQRRDVGVVGHLRGGQWSAAGWDGRRITDEQLGGTGWTGAAAANGVTVIWGRGKALVSRSGGPWTPLAGAPNAVTMTVTADGSPVAIFENGFARNSGGQWRTVGQGAMENAATNAMAASQQQMTANQQAAIASGRVDTAAVRRIQARIEAIGKSIPEGQMPNQAQMTEIMQLQQQLMAAQGGVMPGGMNMQQMQQMQQQAQAMSAEAQRNQAVGARNATLAFGERAIAFASGGTDFYVAGGEKVFHVTGDASKVVFTSMCLYPDRIPASAATDCRADGGTGGAPAAMTIPPAAPRVEGPSIQAPSTSNPLPSIRKPRVRIP